MIEKDLAQVLFGTSALGNLYVALDQQTKLEIVKACISNAAKPVIFDSAGKYGAGLALESLGRCLKELAVRPEDVTISNKLGWIRTELKTPEPTFEPGIWKGLEFDAVQKISYDGILECYEQGNLLLGGYKAEMVSVHDPDEYLANGKDEAEKERLFNDVLEAYKALAALKQQGKVKSIGVGAKDWKVIQKIDAHVKLDWVMIANSMTIHSHPGALVRFMEELKTKGIAIINSAVFNAGFLIGGDFYNYKPVNREQHGDLFSWRDRFFALCAQYAIKPAEVCVQFGLSAPGVKGVALSTSNPGRVKENVKMATCSIPADFWRALKEEGLISKSYPHIS